MITLSRFPGALESWVEHNLACADYAYGHRLPWVPVGHSHCYYLHDAPVAGKIVVRKVASSAFQGPVFPHSVEWDRLIGAQVRILNDGERDACYTVRSAAHQSDGTLRLDVGDTTFIRGLASEADYGLGYVYNFSLEILTFVHVRFNAGNPEVMRTTTNFQWKSTE